MKNKLLQCTIVMLMYVKKRYSVSAMDGRTDSTAQAVPIAEKYGTARTNRDSLRLAQYTRRSMPF